MTANYRLACLTCCGTCRHRIEWPDHHACVQRQRITVGSPQYDSVSECMVCELYEQGEAISWEDVV
jgi:hypothetical protein